MMGLRSIQCAAVALMAALTIVGCGNSDRGDSVAKTTASTTTATTGRTTSTTANTEPAEQRVESSDKTFSVVLPEDWGAAQADVQHVERMKLITAGEKYTDIVVSVFTGAERASTAKEAAEKDMYCKRAVGAEPTTVDGEAAWRCLYTVQDVRGTNLYVLHGDAEYQVIYSSRLEGFNKFEPDYEAVMKSWKWSQ